MDENIEINQPSMKNKKRKVNRWGIYISLCFIIIGVVWYGINIGLIPMQYVQQELGPIILVLIGLLILIKSF